MDMHIVHKQHTIKNERLKNEGGQACIGDSTLPSQKHQSEYKNKQQLIRVGLQKTSSNHRRGSGRTSPKGDITMSLAQEEGSGDRKLWTENTENIFPSQWGTGINTPALPPKFDHVSSLKMTYYAFKETSGQKDGIPLSLVQFLPTVF